MTVMCHSGKLNWGEANAEVEGKFGSKHIRSLFLRFYLFIW